MLNSAILQDFFLSMINDVSNRQKHCKNQLLSSDQIPASLFSFHEGKSPHRQPFRTDSSFLALGQAPRHFCNS